MEIFFYLASPFENVYMCTVYGERMRTATLAHINTYTHKHTHVLTSSRARAKLPDRTDRNGTNGNRVGVRAAQAASHLCVCVYEAARFRGKCVTNTQAHVTAVVVGTGPKGTARWVRDEHAAYPLLIEMRAQTVVALAQERRLLYIPTRALFLLRASVTRRAAERCVRLGGPWLVEELFIDKVI